MKAILSALVFTASLAVAGGANAASWSFAPAGDVPATAEVSLGRAHMFFQCVKGKVSFNLAMPAGQVPEAATMVSISFSPDMMTADSITYYENVQHEMYGSVRSVFFIPEVIDRWLDDASKAKEKLNIGVIPMDADLKGQAVWMEFPVDGSSAAIQQLRDAC